MDADSESHHSDTFAGIKLEAEEIPISIKAESDGVDDYDLKDQPSHKIDTVFDIVRDHSSIEDDKESLECQPRFIEVEHHKTWSEDSSSSSSSSIKNYLIDSDGAGPSLYKLKSEDVDLGRLKMEIDEDSSESSSVEDGRCGKQNSARQTRTHGGKFRVTFDCLKCEKEFSSKVSLDNHVVRTHNDDGKMMRSVTYKIHRCEHCEYATIVKSNLINHMRMHGEKIGITFDCIKCKKKFLSKQTLDSHILTIHSSDVKIMESITNKIHRCDHCKYVTVIRSTLTNHMRTHGENLGIIFDCIKCKRQFSNKQHLDNHIVKMHRNDVNMMKSITNKIHRCEYCEYITAKKTDLTNHMGTHREKFGITFDCIKCKKKLSNKQRLDHHIVTMHHNDVKMMKSITYKMYRCEHCKYVTVRKTDLTSHMKTHGGKFGSTFDCIKCKEFSKKRSLDNHILRKHSTDLKMMKSITYKIHRCEHCTFSTAAPHNMTKHMRTHGG